MRMKSSFLSRVSFISEVAQLCLTPCDPMGPARLLRPWNFPGKNTGVGCHFLLQGIFPTQGLNPGLPLCRQTLLQSEPPGKSSFIRYVLVKKQKQKTKKKNKEKKVFWFSPHHPETDLRLVSLTHKPFRSSWEICQEASLFPCARY